MKPWRSIMNIRTVILRSLACGSIVVAFGFSCAAQEVKLKARQVPRAVVAAFKAAYPQAEIRGYSREKEHGKVFYEIESRDGEVSRDVLYLADGTVAAVEEGMPITDLPQEVQDTLRNSYATAVITSAEKITHDNITEYEVHGKIGKKRIEVKFDATGKVLEVE
jgi:hypothetical protein